MKNSYDQHTEWIWRISLTLLAFGLIVNVLAACGDHPVPKHGRVTGADFTPAWMQWMPGITTCNGTSCSTSPGHPIFWPDRWDLTITDLENQDWVGTVEVRQDVYDRCNLGELWPECSDEKSGDVQ